MVATSLRFSEETLLTLARVAEEFHCRPSDLLRSEITDFQIDVAAAVALWKKRKAQQDEEEGIVEW